MTTVEEQEVSIQQYELQVSDSLCLQRIRIDWLHSLQISSYLFQMSQVIEALKVCTNDTEKASLENLRCDLQEILDLTRETLHEQEGPSKAGETNHNDDDVDDPYAQEMALFMAELEDCDGPSTSNDKPIQSDEMVKFKVGDELFCQ